jgi:hypothetical protein
VVAKHEKSCNQRWTKKFSGMNCAPRGSVIVGLGVHADRFTNAFSDLGWICLF